MKQNKPGTCKLPPFGWYCNLAAGHDGPCPAWPRLWNIKAQRRFL